ncbi:hypothetical protein ABZ499_22025 [Streptomyces sp. NPDC019990]|uniref:hypothetical protein n=1 Tax=Streptomyces sp. NPDC019990 TaxID=3154693 RepID=UPI0034011820
MEFPTGLFERWRSGRRFLDGGAPGAVVITFAFTVFLGVTAVSRFRFRSTYPRTTILIMCAEAR